MSNTPQILIIDDDGNQIDEIRTLISKKGPSSSLSRYEIVGLKGIEELERHLLENDDRLIHFAFVDMRIDGSPRGGVEVANLLERNKIYFAFLSARRPGAIEEDLPKQYDYLVQVLRKGGINDLVVEMGAITQTTYKLLRKDYLLEKKKQEGMAIGYLMGIVGLKRKEAESIVLRMFQDVQRNNRLTEQDIKSGRNEYSIVLSDIRKKNLRKLQELADQVRRRWRA